MPDRPARGREGSNDVKAATNTFETIDPSNGRAIERFERLSPAKLDERLDAAVAAFRIWRTSSVDNRVALIQSIAAELRGQRDRLAALAVREMGKPIVQARAEVDKCAACCDYFADNAGLMLEPQPVPGAAKRYVAFRPLGPVLTIMPWNFPYWQVIRAAIPALLAGNAVLLKHADNTTRCGLEIEQLLHEAGAPDGLFSTLLIDNQVADDAIADSRIAAVTLTGSERAGVAVGAAAGAALKKSVLELGGSDAFVVLADADVQAAASAAVFARFQNNGQSCIAAKRFIVDSTMYDDFVDRFVALVRSQRVGDPSNESTQIGPCARADLREAVAAQVRDSVAAGGRLILGGSTIDRPGFYYEPTVVCEPPSGSPMRAQEVFGPATAVTRARDERHAIELANETTYGLGCSLWTRDTQRAYTLASDIETGMVFVNSFVASDPSLPFGGVKRSGYGRELSHFGMHEFSNVQSVSIEGADK
jgi:succinate-semialdehyde dehydrogenase/glutarate-semialdehyde dehydrogenase